MATATRPQSSGIPSARELRRPRVTGEQVWHELEKASFAVIGYLTPAGEPRSSGVVYKTVDKRLYVEDAVLHVLAPHGGTIEAKRGGALTVHKSLLTAQSVQYDAVVVADGPAVDQFASDPFVGILLQEAYRHHKPIAAWGRGREVLTAFGIPLDANGIVVDECVDNGFGASLVESMGWHRHWER